MRPSSVPRLLRTSLPIVAAMLLALAVVAALWADTASAQTFTPGTQARVAADGDTLRVRAGATVSAPVLASIPDGSIVNIRDGSQPGDGYTWQFIEWDGVIGWVAAEFLQPLGATSTPPPSATVPPAATPPPPATGVATGMFTGNLPPAGKAGLIVWGGGSMESLIATATAQGCNVRSVYTVRNGRFIGYSPGAPAFVNASWDSQVGTLSSVSAVLVYCDLQSQTAARVPSAAGSPSAPATRGGQPPGPGGNES